MDTDYRIQFFVLVGRSGGAFVLNIINYNDDYRIIFEPFNPWERKDGSPIYLSNLHRPLNTNESSLIPAHKIFDGQNTHLVDWQT